jgi:site-specific recombinase XerD
VKTLEAWTKEHLEHERAKGLSPATLDGYACILRRFAAWLRRAGIQEPAAITRELLQHFFLEESQRLSKATPHRELSAIRGFLGFIVKSGALTGNEAQALDLGKQPRAFRRPPSREAIARLLHAPGQSPTGLRDTALFELLYSTGLRRAEACALDLSDCDRSGGTVRVNKGKGGKDRVVPIGKKALEALALYLAKGRPASHPGGPALFVGEWGRRLNPKTLNALFAQWCERAGIEPRITPHLLRHAFATHLLENGADVRHVQAMLGHAWIGTTAVYTHVSFKHLREETEKNDPRARLEEAETPAFPE